ncbi:hypothetical protein GCM10009422_28800 [Brevundimonas kwangchunensis]|uniref:Uracil-DNA glycosylase n=2 Tax=Brevundimonas kwangchunensis TaxID=322163 RepID=A0ABP3S9F4_9CAUL
MVHASAVRIDKRSCRPCEVIFYGHNPPPFAPRDLPRGRLIQSTAPEDPIKAARFREEIAALGYPLDFDQGAASERK